MEIRIVRLATYVINYYSSVTGLKVAGIYRFYGDVAEQMQKLRYRIDRGTHIRIL